MNKEILDKFSTPDRLWINEDGDVFTASGQDDPFLPTIEINNGRCYCGDEIHYVSKEHVFNYGEHWHTSMCIPKVKEYQIKKESYEYLIERFKKMFPDSPLSDA